MSTGASLGVSQDGCKILPKGKWESIMFSNTLRYSSQPVKIDLDKKLDPKQKNIQAFNIDT